MGNFSKTPLEVLADNLGKGYVGLHVEQGVPVLDRDLNLLGDLLNALTRRALSRYIGNGIAAGVDGFQITATSPLEDNNFLISPGTCLVGGVELTLVGTQPVKYTAQTVPPSGVPLALLTTPAAARQDIVYLDTWFDEITGSGDSSLKNDDDIGVQTSVRIKPVFVVRVAENAATSPPPLAGHTHYPLANLSRRASTAQITPDMMTDLRSTRLTASDIERRVSIVERLLMPAFAPAGFELNRTSGPPGVAVELSGRNFDLGNMTVYFDDTQAEIINGPPTASKIQVRVPLMKSGSKVVKIVFDLGNGLTGTLLSTLRFSVQISAKPAFGAPGAQINPPSGGPGAALILTGANFYGMTLKVVFESTPPIQAVGPIARPDGTRITLVVPDGLPSNTDVKISVTHDGGTDKSDDDFHIT